MHEAEMLMDRKFRIFRKTFKDWLLIIIIIVIKWIIIIIITQKLE